MGSGRDPGGVAQVAGRTLGPRTSVLGAAHLEDMRQVVREELQIVLTRLDAIADAVRKLSSSVANPEELMTVPQVAEEVKVAPTTVRMWIHSGELPAIRPGVGRGPGRTFRIARADLKEFVASVRERVPESEADARRAAAVPDRQRT